MVNFKKLFDDFSKNICDNSPIDFGNFSDKDLYKYCKTVGFNARKWHRRFIAVLPEVAKRRLYKKYGYCSLHEFAAKLAGISRENVDDVLRVDEKLKKMPKIKSLIGESGLNKVRLVANIAKPETENFWAEKIRNMTFSSLRILINEKFRFKTEDEKTVKISQGEGKKGMFDSETFRSQQGDVSTGKIFVTAAENFFQAQSESNSTVFIKNKKPFTIHIDDETEFELRKFKQQLEKVKKEPVDWNFTLKEMVKRASNEKFNEQKVVQKKSHPNVKFATDGPRNKTPIHMKSQTSNKPVSRYHSSGLKQSKITRYIPAKIKHGLQQKYNGRCAYRGCNKPAEQIHHPTRFAHRPNHENLLPLCREHHDFVHQNSAETEVKIFNKFRSEKAVASG